MQRTLSILLALLGVGNGLAMLIAGRWWYGAVPGVVATGPYNPHFVRDIGAAYLAAGLAFAARAARATSRTEGAAAVGAAFLALHGLIHLGEALGDPAGLADLTRDFPGVLLPAILAVAAAWPSRPQPEPRHA